MTWRNATATADTSGASYFQTAYTNNLGEITSFTSGENKIEKYLSADKLNVIYKKILDTILLSTVGLTNSSTDGETWTSHSLDLGSSHVVNKVPKKIGETWYTVVYDYGNYFIYSSSDLNTWTKITGSSFGYPYFIFGDSSTLIRVETGSSNFYYSTNGGNSWTLTTTTHTGYSFYSGVMAFGKILIFATDDADPSNPSAVISFNLPSSTTGTVNAISIPSACNNPIDSVVTSDGKVYLSLLSYYDSTTSLVRLDSISSHTEIGYVMGGSYSSIAYGGANACLFTDSSTHIATDTNTEPSDLSQFIAVYYVGNIQHMIYVDNVDFIIKTSKYINNNWIPVTSNIQEGYWWYFTK